MPPEHLPPLLLQAQQPICLLDDTRRCQAHNPAALRLLTLEPEQLQHCLLDPLVAEAGLWSNWWAGVLRQGHGQLRMQLRPDGGPCTVQAHASARVRGDLHLLLLLPLAELPPDPRLSRRELEVLQLLEAGATSQGVAAQLGIRPATVEHHVGSIKRRLGAQTRAQAVGLALRSGLLD